MQIELTETQSNFLSRYYNSLGDLQKSLNDLGLEYLHFREWLKTPYFKMKFNEMQLEVNEFLTIENTSIAKRRINTILKEGLIETEEISCIELDSNNEVVRELTTRKIKRKEPVEAIRSILGEKSTEYAINLLSERGVLAKPIARQLLSTANEYQQKLQDSFELNKEDANINNDEKTIALIKQALIGSLEDIQ